MRHYAFVGYPVWYPHNDTNSGVSKYRKVKGGKLLVMPHALYGEATGMCYDVYMVYLVDYFFTFQTAEQIT